MAQASKSASSYPERKKAAMYAKTDVWQGRVARLLVILLMCVQPIFFSTERYIRLTLHKYQFFCISMIAVLLFALVIWVYRLTRKPRLLLQEQFTLADWAVLGFAIVTILSALLSPFKDVASVWVGKPEPEGRYDGAITQLLYVAVFFVVARWYRPRVRDFAVFGVSAALIGLIGILQFYGMDFLKLWPNHIDAYHVDNFYRIFFRSTLGNVDIVSTYVCVAILLCGFLFVRMKSRWQPLWIAASALNFWLMDLAGADSGRIGVLAAMVLALPFIVENRKVFGRTLLLGASWIAVYTLQNLLYDVRVVKARTFSSLLPYIVALAALLIIGLVLLYVVGRGEKGGRRGAGSSGRRGVRGGHSGVYRSNSGYRRKTVGANGSFSNATEPGETKSDYPGSEADAPSRWLLGVILIGLCIVIGIVGIEVIGRRAAASDRPSGIIYEIREVMHGNMQDTFGSYRGHIWKNAIRAYPNYPLIGSGPDTFYHAFPPEAHLVYGGVNYDKAHNEYLQILICQGLLGLLCYLLFLVTASLKAIPKAFRNPLVMAVLAAFIGYCVQAFFNISLPIASQMMWIFVGMLANKRFRNATLREIT